jgi:hypothetical protein
MLITTIQMGLAVYVSILDLGEVSFLGALQTSHAQ